jgi:hypothetical protein
MLSWSRALLPLRPWPLVNQGPQCVRLIFLGILQHEIPDSRMVLHSFHEEWNLVFRYDGNYRTRILSFKSIESNLWMLRHEGNGNVCFTNIIMPFMFLVSHATINTTGNAGATMDLISSTKNMGGQKARMHHLKKQVKMEVGAGCSRNGFDCRNVPWKSICG